VSPQVSGPLGQREDEHVVLNGHGHRRELLQVRRERDAVPSTHQGRLVHRAPDRVHGAWNAAAEAAQIRLGSAELREHPTQGPGHRRHDLLRTNGEVHVVVVVGQETASEVEQSDLQTGPPQGDTGNDARVGGERDARRRPPARRGARLLFADESGASQCRDASVHRRARHPRESDDVGAGAHGPCPDERKYLPRGHGFTSVSHEEIQPDLGKDGSLLLFKVITW
jgi:hypothetical protein